MSLRAETSRLIARERALADRARRAGGAARRVRVARLADVPGATSRRARHDAARNDALPRRRVARGLSRPRRVVHAVVARAAARRSASEVLIARDARVTRATAVVTRTGEAAL